MYFFYFLSNGIYFIFLHITSFGEIGKHMPFDDPVMAGKGVIVKIARSYVEACGA